MSQRLLKETHKNSACENHVQRRSFFEVEPKTLPVNCSNKTHEELANALVRYDKIMLNPKSGQSFSPEELAAYKWFKKSNIVNNFTIAQDAVWENRCEVGIRLPPLFCTRNYPQDHQRRSFGTEIHERTVGQTVSTPVEDEVDPTELPVNILAKSNEPFEKELANTIVRYDKIMLNPKSGQSFSPEEFAAYKWFKKSNIINNFTIAQDAVWENRCEVGIRLPPLFCAGNGPQEPFTPKRNIEHETNAVLEAYSPTANKQQHCSTGASDGSDNPVSSPNKFDVVDESTVDKLVQQSLLDQIGWKAKLQCELNTYNFVNVWSPPLSCNTIVKINQHDFSVQSLIAKGSYGSIFSCKSVQNGRMYAIKEVHSSNLWEHYISLEIQNRIKSRQISTAFVKAECAVIGTESILIVTQLSPYGTMLTVRDACTAKLYKSVPECAVMVLAIQMLTIVDHLHNCKIIHANIKPNKWLLMRRLDFNPNHISLKLTDFERSIDVTLWPDGQRICTTLNVNRRYVCMEMLNDRPWTFRADLYNLASTVHSLLFGCPMTVQGSHIEGYRIAEKIPRYYARTLWTSFFDTLINFKDGESMPNLQMLQLLLMANFKANNSALVDVRAFNQVIDDAFRSSFN